MLSKCLEFVRTKSFIAGACLLIGVVSVLSIRFFTYKVDAIHYHANFALYINGQREEFKGVGYYSEIEMCTINKEVVPNERAHMHDNINDVVHVEDHAVTWGQFFTNIGWIVGPTFIATPDGTIYAENSESKLHLLLNNKDYTDLGGLQNTVIKDNDKLLISFGSNSDTTLKQQYDAIPSTAKKYDNTKDPASCSGGHTTTMRDRFDHMF